jgi:uncharacterized zinc-type alcohol dehydrogenase-like protein
MKININAWAVKSPAGILEPFTYEQELRALDVLIAIKYCSLTRGDVGFIDNLWRDTTYPLVPGSEIFGTVKKTGESVRDLEVGDFVGVGYQITSCFTCRYCRQGKEQFCRRQKVVGVDGFGGLADHIVSDSRFVFKIPLNLQTSFHVPLMCSGLSIYAALKKAGVRRGMTVGLVGVGNLGHLALQVLDKMDCKVAVFSHSPHKEAKLRELGAENFVSSVDKKALKRESDKYDVILSACSAPLDWELYLKALTPEGTICFVGLPPKNISFPAAVLADHAQRRIQGSYIGSRSEMKEWLDFASKHEIKALAEIYPLSEANAVISMIRNGQIPFSVVLERKK